MKLEGGEETKRESERKEADSQACRVAVLCAARFPFTTRSSRCFATRCIALDVDGIDVRARSAWRDSTSCGAVETPSQLIIKR